MKIIAISDTYSFHRQVEIPEGDVLVHAGDISWKGELDIIEDFSNWLKELPHQKIVIGGNHELGLERGSKRKQMIDFIVKSGAHYLEDDGIEIDGVKFHGSPITPYFFDWEFNRQRGADIKHHWDLIPDDTNVVITHGPPYGILDKVKNNHSRDPHQGCEELLKRLKQLPNLKASIFGHIHEAAGEIEIDGVKYVNAATCTSNYDPTNKPIIINI